MILAIKDTSSKVRKIVSKSIKVMIPEVDDRITLIAKHNPETATLWLRGKYDEKSIRRSMHFDGSELRLAWDSSLKTQFRHLRTNQEIDAEMASKILRNLSKNRYESGVEAIYLLILGVLESSQKNNDSCRGAIPPHPWKLASGALRLKARGWQQLPETAERNTEAEAEIFAKL